MPFDDDATAILYQHSVLCQTCMPYRNSIYLFLCNFTYTYKIEQKGGSAKANPLNTNDLGRFNRQELCRLFGGWDSWVLELRPMLAEIGEVRLEPLSMLIEVVG